MSTLIQAVQAVRQTLDKRWIPEEFRGPSYFSQWDEWLYETQETTTVCPECEANGEQGTFIGSELRSLFPYLVIEDENTIYPYIHPNCHCRLVRSTFVERII